MIERMQYAIAWALIKLLGVLPRALARSLAASGADLLLWMLPKLRETAEFNLQLAFPEWTPAKRREVKGVYLSLLGRDGTFTAIVEPKRQSALIGAIVLEDLDLLLDCQHQRVVPRDPQGAVYEIE